MAQINVTRSSMPSFEEYCEEIRDLWDSHWLTNMGVKHMQLQSELKRFLEVPQVTLYTNGHLALEHVLAAMHLPAGGEVITTPYTFVSTTHAIARNNLVPVFCDINDVDYTMDVTKIEALITEKTCAIVPVHVYGNLCDVDAIDRLAKRYGLKVIYDAAHAFGTAYQGTGIANFGDASIFSFHATKVFNTIEGGAVCYRDEALTPVLDRMKNFGLPGTDSPYTGGNAKMNEFQAAMGLCNLRHVKENIARRRVVAEHYRRRLSDVAGIRLCGAQAHVQSNYAYFPVIFDGPFDRNAVYEKLKAENIFPRKYFYPLTSEFLCYRDLPSAGAEKTPVAKYITEHVLTLPHYADLALEDVDRICDIILG